MKAQEDETIKRVGIFIERICSKKYVIQMMKMFFLQPWNVIKTDELNVAQTSSSSSSSSMFELSASEASAEL